MGIPPTVCRGLAWAGRAEDVLAASGRDGQTARIMTPISPITYRPSCRNNLYGETRLTRIISDNLKVPALSGQRRDPLTELTGPQRWGCYFSSTSSKMLRSASGGGASLVPVSGLRSQ